MLAPREMNDVECPKCGAFRVYRNTEFIAVKLSSQAEAATWAGWYVCLECWYKFDAVHSWDKEYGVVLFPPGVNRRSDDRSAD